MPGPDPVLARIRILSVVFLLVCATPGGAQSFDLEEVTSGVYAAIPRPGVPAGANAAFIVNEDHVVVVDTHMRPSFARDLTAQIAALTPLPVRYVVNTHWHPDHTQGTQSYVSAFGPGVVVVSHETARQDIETLGLARLTRDREALPVRIAELEAGLAASEDSTAESARRLRQGLEDSRAFLQELELVNLVLPSVTFERSLALHRGRRPIQFLYFGRGHTRGDIIVYLPRDRVAIIGDLVTGGPPFARDGYPSQWIDTLAAVGKLDIEVVVPGHGRVMRGKQVLTDRIQFLETAMDVVKQGRASGWSTDRIADAIDLDRYRPTFDPEPPDRPWRGWMRTLVERALVELGANVPEAEPR